MEDSAENKLSGSQHTVRSVSYGTLWRVLRFPFVLLSAIFLPRVMGDAAYGQFAVFMSVYLLLDIITDVGLMPAFGRFLPEIEARDPREGTRFLHGMMLYGVLITAVVVVAVGIPLHLAGKLDFAPNALALMCLLLFATKIEGTLFSFLYGLNHIGRYSSKDFTRSAATFIFVTGLYLLYGLAPAMWGLLGTEVLLVAMGAWWSRGRLFVSAGNIRFGDFKPYFVFGLQFYLPTLLFGFMQRAGTVLVKELSGSYSEAGYYDVANQFMVMTVTVLALVFTTLLPSSAALQASGDQQSIIRRYRAAMTYCVLAVMLSLHALIMLGKPVIVLCLGPAFEPVYGNAIALGAAMPFVLVIYAGMNFSMLEKKPSVFAWSVFAGLAVMAALCIATVPRWDSNGAALSTVAGYAAAAGVFLVKYRKQFRGIVAGLLKVLVPAVIFMPFYMVECDIRQALGLFIASSAIYVLFLILLRWIKVSDIRAVLNAMKKRD